MAYTYKYPRPAVTADCIVITKEAEPKVLLIQRGDEPFKGTWAFPGGFMDMDETTEQCAITQWSSQHCFLLFCENRGRMLIFSDFRFLLPHSSKT